MYRAGGTSKEKRTPPRDFKNCHLTVCSWGVHIPRAKRTAKRNLKYVAEFGRWDDLYLFVNTALEKDAFEFMKN